jgi:hypothetical protein
MSQSTVKIRLWGPPAEVAEVAQQIKGCLHILSESPDRSICFNELVKRYLVASLPERTEAKPPPPPDRSVVEEQLPAHQDPRARAIAIFKSELAKLISAPEGHRRDRLYQSSRMLASLIGPGRLDRSEVEAALEHTALAAGLSHEMEIKEIITNGLTAGMSRKRPG